MRSKQYFTSIKNNPHEISTDPLQFFDDRKHEWVAEPGKFKAYISSSSADTQNIVEFEYK